MSIRGVNKNDIAKVKGLITSLAHFYLNDKEKILPEWFVSTLTDAEFLNRIENPEYENFLYETKGSVIGYISIKDKNHLCHIFVSEK